MGSSSASFSQEWAVHLDQWSPIYCQGVKSGPPQSFIQPTVTCDFFGSEDLLKCDGVTHYIKFLSSNMHYFSVIITFLFCLDSYHADYKKGFK